MKQQRNNILARTDAPEAADMAVVVAVKGFGPDPSVIDVVVDGIAGEEDAGNSTVTPLAGAGVFTGTIFDANNHASFAIYVTADARSGASGSVAGLQFDWFSDAAGTLLVGRESYSVFASVPLQLKLNHRGRYFRVVYTNNASVAQTSFRISTYHKPISIEDQLVPYGGGGMFGNLGAAGTLVSDPVDVRGFSTVSFSIDATTASATDGLLLQWSEDGANWNTNMSIPLSVAASDEFTVELPHIGRFFRVNYTNGGAGSLVNFAMVHNRVTKAGCVTAGFEPSVSRVAVNIASVTLLAANRNRKSALITNYSPGSSILYVKLGSAANIGAGTESFTAIINNGGFFRIEVDEYDGIVTGIWNAADANGAALCTEVLRS